MIKSRDRSSMHDSGFSYSFKKFYLCTEGIYKNTIIYYDKIKNQYFNECGNPIDIDIIKSKKRLSQKMAKNILKTHKKTRYLCLTYFEKEHKENRKS